MAAIKESAEEDKEVESFTYDTQDLTSTSSYNNNSLDPPEPLPLDSHQNPLNGVQSNPFVCGSVPAAPSTNDSLPSRALVNGAASHCTSEEPCVHNKDMSPLPGTDTSPEVLPPPSELQSDTRQKTEGCVLKEWLTRASSESNNGDGEAPLDVPVEEGLDNRPISRLLARKQIKAGCLWDFDSELSESSSDDCDGLNWGLQEKFMQLLLKSSVAGGGVRNKIAGAPPANQRRRMRKTHTMENATTGGQIYDGFDYASQNSLTDEDSDFDSSINKEHAFRKEPESLKAYAGLRLEKFCDKAAAMKELISSENEERCDEGRSEIDTNTYMGEKLSPFKAETKQGKELSFFPCSKCNANFKEKIHLHRHMMYHLDGNNKVKQEFVPRPFICRECGRSFRGLNSLQKHMVIHQVQRERLMEEIKSLGKIDVERRRACIQCVFGTKCPQTFGSTNEREGNSCEDHMTRTEMEHQCTSIHNKYDKSTDLIICQMCTFKCYSKDAFRKHMVLIHGQQYYEFHEPHSNMDHIRTASDIIADQPKTADSTLLFSKPKIPSTQMWSVTDEGELALRTNGSADLNVRSKETQKACDGFCSSLIKWSPGSQANKLSPFSRRSDTPSKLSPLPTEKIDVTTGLPYVEEDNQEYESTVAEKRTKYLSSFDVNLTTKTEIISKPSCLISNTESCPNDPSSNSTLAPQTLKHKIPSKRKMSIPYRNIHVNIPHVRFPNCEPESSRWESHQLQEDEDDDYDVAQDNSNCTKESLDQFYNNTPSDYFISGQASPFDSNVPDDVNQSNLDHNIDSDEICTLIIKEECIESIIGEDSPDPVYGQSDPYADYAVPTLSLVGRKCCPYCPAVFESGVGLSNHVRGHMHRVGLSYEARHMVSPEQVASQDRQPRIRRKVHPVNRRIRKDEIEPKTEHTCPLCLGWFDTKTGLSNHVRGHLKRIGKPISGASKSPLSILTELLQDETEYKNIIRVLGARPHISKHFVSQKFASSDGLFLTSTGIPVKIQHGAGTERQWDQIRPSRENTEKGSFEKIQSSNLEHLLENRKVEKMEALCKLEEADTHWSIFTCGSIPKTPSVKLDPTWSQEKFGVNKKICIHCNATFHSGVSLSNHLRAYARRKRIALLEGTTYDCKQKRSRSRSGPKRKVFSSSHPATEVIYRMTCRFCDLIFQGPQSVQEDWIKHLQRHLMHTSIPGMGTGMVEVSAMCKELCSQTPPERLLLDTQPPLSLSEGIS